MKKHILSFSFFCFLLCTKMLGQNHMAEFAGNLFSDPIVVPNASQVLVNSDAYTMSAWVKFNPAEEGDFFDGIMGFRNACDFYLLRIGDERLEARFTGVEFFEYTSTTNVLLVDEWMHLALVHSNDSLIVYVNGEVVDSISAPGKCELSDLDFVIGSAAFGFDGAIDEVRFWSEARTQQQIQEHMHTEISNPESEPTLMMYFDLNEEVGSSIVQNKGQLGIDGDVFDFVTFTNSTAPITITSIFDLHQAEIVNIYPNPTNGLINVEVINADAPFQVKILNSQGRLVEIENEVISQSLEQFDLRDLQAGIYYVHLTDQTQSIVKRIIIQ